VIVFIAYPILSAREKLSIHGTVEEIYMLSCSKSANSLLFTICLSIIAEPSLVRARPQLLGLTAEGNARAIPTAASPQPRDSSSQDDHSLVSQDFFGPEWGHGPPDGLSPRDWIMWFDARHNDQHALWAFAAHNSLPGTLPNPLILANPFAPARMRSPWRFTAGASFQTIVNTATEFMRRFSAAAGRGEELDHLQRVQLLVECVRAHLPDPEDLCTQHAYLLVRTVDLLQRVGRTPDGVQMGFETPQFRAYWHGPRPELGSGHAWNRLAVNIRGRTVCYVVDAMGAERGAAPIIVQYAVR
jgi:hypothetical protein